MLKIQEATNLLTRLIVTLVLIAQFSDTVQALSDKRLCADEKCKDIISLGTGKINYRAGQEGMVSFKINAPIRIKSKSAGKDPSLWGIEVNGREGYAPKQFIRENKIIIGEKNLKYEVNVVQPASQVPVLNASENVQVGQEDVVEATTTRPLDVTSVESKEEPIVKNPVENASTEKPAMVTPVLMEMVDGTQLPIMKEESDGVVEELKEEDKLEQTKTQSAEDEDDENDEIGDYDDDEENIDLENEDFQPKTEPKPLSSMENIEISENLEGNQEPNINLNNSNSSSSPENVLKKETNLNNQSIPSSSKNGDEITETPPENLLKKETNFNDQSIPSSDETTEALPISEILSESNEISSSEEIKTFEQVASSEKIDEKASENQNIHEELSLPSSPHEEQQIELTEDSQIDQHTLDNHMETYDSTISTNEQPPIIANAEVPAEELTIQEKPQNVPTESTVALEETLENVKTTEALNAADDDGNVLTVNISSTQSLPDNKKSAEVISEENASIENQPNLEKDEIIVSEVNENQINNIELSNEYIETHNDEQTNKETDNLHTNPDHTLYPQFTTQTENLNPEQVITDSLIVSQNSIEIQQKSTESILNTQTEIPLNIETESTEAPTTLPSSIADNIAYQQTNTESPPLPSNVLNNDPYQQQTDYVSPTPYNPYDDAPSNTPLPPRYDNVNPESSYAAQTTEIPQIDNYDQQPTENSSSDFVENDFVTENSNLDQSSVGYDSVEVLATPEPPKIVEEAPKALPSLTPPFNEDSEVKENKGLFATIMGTVNNMLSSNKKAKHEEHDELHRILFPVSDDGLGVENKNEANGNVQYCEKLDPNGNCPHSESKQSKVSSECECSFTKTIFTADLTFDTFIQALSSKILEISDLIAFLSVVAAASLFFIFGYYCFCNSSREGALLSKLNQLESSLLATHKENAILKHNLMSTRQKLASIEDNSFGSNDMVVSLKKELEEELVEKARLQEQISNLQKELENAADAGIELNKIVSELLSNQTGDESIISSVEELQKQLNEQQNTILEINSSLAEKSRENSELQLLIAEQNARYESEIANLQRDNDELDQEKGNLQTRLEEIRSEFDKDITAALEGKNFEIKRLQNEIVELGNKLETEHTKWQTSMAKVEALEECLKNVKRDPNVNITQVIDVANVRAELLDAQRKCSTLKERLEIELDSRRLAEKQLQIVSAEVEKLKQDFNETEKDKLEAQTRLEVLSNYFKDKENQLQKELSLKETMWLKQQGETTTTVDRLTAMQEEIQSLKSQNDSLRAEIDAQLAAHKAQTGTLENRAHETWLAARQSDRRYEEARAEATALRRKLTALAGGNVNEANKPPAGSAGLGEELTNAPSPIHMESPGSPMLGRMPPPPFLPPPFMGPPPPFMGMPPPPPFVPPGEMRPAPLGRIMSPPPQRSGRFSPQHLDYEDYLDYEGNNSWHRHTYSPPPRTYRSLSPTDSRYNYGTERDLISTYDTETDFSPPPSPRESRRRGGPAAAGNGSERGSNTRSPYNNSKKSNSGNKGPVSSGSEKSYNSSSQPVGKTKGGIGGGGGKSLV